jgi:hypothetical protein
MTMKSRLLILSLILAGAAAALPARAQSVDELSARVAGITGGWGEAEGGRSIRQDLWRYAHLKAVVTETYVYIYGVVAKGEGPFPGTYYVVGISDVNGDQLKNAGLGLKKTGPGAEDYVLIDHRNGDAAVAPADFVAAVKDSSRFEIRVKSLAELRLMP